MTTICCFRISRPEISLLKSRYSMTAPAAFARRSTGTPSTCEETLDTIEDPGVDTGFSFTYRLSATTGGFVVSLKQGATTIASWTHGPGGPATFERAITPAEAATITYPATLTLRIEATT